MRRAIHSFLAGRNIRCSSHFFIRMLGCFREYSLYQPPSCVRMNLPLFMHHMLAIDGKSDHAYHARMMMYLTQIHRTDIDRNLPEYHSAFLWTTVSSICRMLSIVRKIEHGLSSLGDFKAAYFQSRTIYHDTRSRVSTFDWNKSHS